MYFNSIEFFIFLPVVFALFWIVQKRGLRTQNSFLIIASYFFYGWWDWRFLGLIIISSAVDFLVGLGLKRTELPNKRKLLLGISVFVNIGFLAFFKYFNFFAQSFADAFTLFGRELEVERLDILLPVGISFYTFQSLSYTIDIYRNRIEPRSDPIAFFAYVSFFPQLVAGPIERAVNFLPQFETSRHFDYSKAVDGVRQILWGLFKKMVIADNCALLVNTIFRDSDVTPGSTLFLAAFLFAFQIYGDFSGYSDIAIGSGRLFGFNLTKNFDFPYFSRDIAEFWRRWHISLSTWFRDYVYFPLGGSRKGKLRAVLNTFIVFVVSGLWHGANWTFVVWGLLNAIFFLPLMLFNLNRSNIGVVSPGKLLPGLGNFLKISLTFVLVTIAWIFFRSESLSQATSIIAEIFSASFFTFPNSDLLPKRVFVFIFILMGVEWLQRGKEHGLDFSNLAIPAPLRLGIYYAVVMLILLFAGEPEEFIYFQF